MSIIVKTGLRNAITTVLSFFVSIKIEQKPIKKVIFVHFLIWPQTVSSGRRVSFEIDSVINGHNNLLLIRPHFSNDILRAEAHLSVDDRIELFAVNVM